MEVPIINRISDLDVGINDPTVLSRGFAVSGVGKLHLWKWGALLLLAIFASFTSLTTRIKTLVFRLRNVNVSLPSSSSTILCDYDSDYSDWSFSSDSSEEDVDEDEEEDESDNGDSRVKRFGYYDDGNKGINGNVPWLKRCGDSFGELLDLGSSGVVKLWENLEFKGEGSHVASFLSKCSSSYSLLSPAVLFAGEKKGSEDDVEVSAWDSREPGRLFGKIIRVDKGDVDKIYVGDLRMANGGLTELNRMVRRRGRRH